ncbi:hypothetical protein [Bacillus horti]|uniref:Uncharacterized protein n=1 Tax=Caldalkalibacillus horti TaxID=77523 RepID=A0ABT9VZK4_9BACI|nr:hypothetical protein [Bacillus horti]MDQ0166409.1 hypothetical protein [Bacillus horti]
MVENVIWLGRMGTWRCGEIWGKARVRHGSALRHGETGQLDVRQMRHRVAGIVGGCA